LRTQILKRRVEGHGCHDGNEGGGPALPRRRSVGWPDLGAIAKLDDDHWIRDGDDSGSYNDDDGGSDDDDGGSNDDDGNIPEFRNPIYNTSFLCSL
jgi:hypothetical protein